MIGQQAYTYSESSAWNQLVSKIIDLLIDEMGFKRGIGQTSVCMVSVIGQLSLVDNFTFLSLFIFLSLTFWRRNFFLQILMLIYLSDRGADHDGARAHAAPLQVHR